jgi:hypothetical protein
MPLALFMQGHPVDFETIGSRLGFQVKEESVEQLQMVWHGTRFPGLLCLGVSLALLFLSAPIVEAIRLRGFNSPVGVLWYFPVMNLILPGVAVFLLSRQRTITLDKRSGNVCLSKRGLFARKELIVNFEGIVSLKLVAEQVYSGFGVAGSTAGQSFPALSLRLVLGNDETILLDRGGRRRLEELGHRLSYFLDKPLIADG